MQIEISFSGLESHLELLDEEKRRLHALRDSLQNAESRGMILDLQAFQRCMQQLDQLEQSIRFRREWLETVLEEFRMVKRRNQALIEEAENQVQHLL
ncbi:MAG: hypothetical protein IKF59_04005 [Lachnospiraceae bacterium]|jgi:hypothetical protein|nr:hypothetical protein [Lachnospiraceae bacterium]